MGKFIFYIAIAALIYWVIKKRSHQHKETEKFSESIANMVSCAYCDIHLPESDAVNHHNNQFFCCQEHLNLYTNSSF